MREAAPPELSVVIPARHEPMIGDTVRTVLDVARREGGGDVEIIVVGVGDWSALPDDPAVRVVEPDPPLWPGRVRNRGLAEARGETLVFLDADCFPLPGWYAGIRASCSAEPAIRSGAMVTPTDNFWQACYNLACLREYLDGLPAEPRSFLPTFSLWGPRRAFEDVGGLDDTLSGAEDIDMTIRLGRAGWRLLFDPSVRVLHRPAARSFGRIVRTGWYKGGNSVHIRRRYPDAFGKPSWTLAPAVLTLGAPFAAAYLYYRTFRDHPQLRRICLRGAAAIYTCRMAWCFGAAWSSVRPRRVFEPVAHR